MGAVLRGRDTDLGRDLAIKVLLDEHKTKPEVIQRFVEEAQIGGQLQHPGIAPIYELGQFSDQRPFFSMKLVKGKTLAKLLSDRRNPLEERSRFVGIFEHVCQTMAYAHSRGVIHRDLKPANIMVGAFGEVQVMDWGLAKVLQSGGVEDEKQAQSRHKDISVIQTSRSHGGDTPISFGSDTMNGSVMGTPAYMSPEQALGEIDQINERADVFGLGAILCEILTGQPPYVDGDPSRVYRMATRGKLDDCFARLESCGADADLVSMTMQCLEPEPKDRPRDGGVVAEQITSYLESVETKLRRAEVQRAAEAARVVEQKKRLKVTLGLAASLLIILLGGGLLAWQHNQQTQLTREREVRNAEAVAALLDRCEEALMAGDAARATVAMEAASKQVQEGGWEGHGARLTRLDADLALLRDLDAIDHYRWTPTENRFPAPTMVAKRIQEALKRFGADPETVPIDIAESRANASSIRNRIVAALDRLLLPIRLVDPNLQPPDLRTQYNDNARFHTEVEAMLPTTYSARNLLRRLDTDPYRNDVRDAVVTGDRVTFVKLAEQTAAQEQPPGFIVSLVSSKALEVERIRRLLESALVRMPENLDLLMALGNTYLTNRDDAIEERLRWFQAAVAAAPTVASTHNSLGIALRDDRQWDEAEAHFNRAIELDPGFASAHSNLGVVMAEVGKFDDSIACCKRAIELDPDYASAHNNLGYALQCKRQWDEAINSLSEAVNLAPLNAEYHSNLAAVLVEAGRTAEAINHCREAIKIDPALARAHGNLGGALEKTGDIEAAIASRMRAVELAPTDAVMHFDLGGLLSRHGFLAQGVAALREAITLDPDNAEVHSDLGVALSDMGLKDEAAACYEKAIEIAPDLAQAHSNLGALLCDVKGKYPEAIACFKKAIEIDPKEALYHSNLGRASMLSGMIEEAISAYQRSSELNPEDSRNHLALGDILMQQGLLDEAAASYEKAIELQPDFAEAHCNLGGILGRQGRFTESLSAIRRGHELGSQRPDWPYPSAKWLSRAERMAAAESRLPAFLDGEWQPADNSERFGMAELTQVKRFHHAATRLYSEAFDADPEVADDLASAYRYNAACTAILAAAGEGNDADKLDDKERDRLRKQALDWLKADLERRASQIESGQPDQVATAQRSLLHWQNDTDLASIRDPAPLARLSSTERTAFAELWSTVASLLEQTK